MTKKSTKSSPNAGPKSKKSAKSNDDEDDEDEDDEDEGDEDGEMEQEESVDKDSSFDTNKIERSSGGSTAFGVVPLIQENHQLMKTPGALTVG
ncbi:MAG: hypothetical protein M1821_007934 [Bathelium mastoideum]|nr:MAG: hypothetical protein M1821_007934 [Bathelium mastoideum]KAI9692981.1 MAG: hypothetical protein M1822_004976 [Bathelium mastoideum]